MLALCYCSGLSLVVASGGSSPAAVHKLLTVVASFVAEPWLEDTWTPGVGSSQA